MTQRDRVLSMLRARRYVTSLDFAREGILRYSARIEELRSEGYSIVTMRHTVDGKTLFRYELESKLSGAKTTGDHDGDRSQAWTSVDAVEAPESSESLFDLPPSAISAITGKRAA